jgi:flagellar FliL protein
MADDDRGADGDEAEGSAKKGKRLILVIGLIVLLLGGGGAGLYFSGLLGGKKEEPVEEAKAPAEQKKAEAKAGEPAKQGDPVFFELPEFINNLNTGSTQTSFIKVSIILEIGSAEDLARVQTMQPRIMDDFNTYLRELRATDLAGSAGLERLREELLRRVNKATSPAKVHNILFKEIIVQ